MATLLRFLVRFFSNKPRAYDRKDNWNTSDKNWSEILHSWITQQVFIESLLHFQVSKEQDRHKACRQRAHHHEYHRPSTVSESLWAFHLLKDLHRYWFALLTYHKGNSEVVVDTAYTLLSHFVFCSFWQCQVSSFPLQYSTAYPLWSRWLFLWHLLQPSVPLHGCLLFFPPY